MELDHVLPKADGGENFITNRILICRPCNRRKSNMLTMSGLVRANKRDGWTKDEALAQTAQLAARSRAEQVRAESEAAGLLVRGFYG